MPANTNPVEKQWVKMLTVDPRKRRIEGVLKDYTPIQIALYDVPIAFRWPKEGEWWIVSRENYEWFLKAPRQEPGTTTPIENLAPGDTQIGIEDSSVKVRGTIEARKVQIGGIGTSETQVTSPKLMTYEGRTDISGVLNVVGQVLVDGDLDVMGQILHNGDPIGGTVTNWSNETNRVTSINRDSWTNQQLFDFIATMLHDLQQ